jgi:hypothetical protein
MSPEEAANRVLLHLQSEGFIEEFENAWIASVLKFFESTSTSIASKDVRIEEFENA